MNAKPFLKYAIDPEEWGKKSIALRRSGDVLWEQYLKARKDAAAKEDKDRPLFTPIDAQPADDFLLASKMFYGLALETAFKARILKEQPDKVKLRVSLDGNGEPQSVEIEDLGVSLKSGGHGLIELARAAGVFRVTVGNTEQEAHEAILADLSETVVWMAKYPVPKRSADRARSMASPMDKEQSEHVQLRHLLDKYVPLSPRSIWGVHETV